MCTQATGHDTEAAKIALLSLQNHSNLGEIGDISSWLQYENSSGAQWFFSTISVWVQIHSSIWNLFLITVIHYHKMDLQDRTIATLSLKSDRILLLATMVKWNIVMFHNCILGIKMPVLIRTSKIKQEMETSYVLWHLWLHALIIVQHFCTQKQSVCSKGTREMNWLVPQPWRYSYSFCAGLKLKSEIYQQNIQFSSPTLNSDGKASPKKIQHTVWLSSSCFSFDHTI